MGMPGVNQKRSRISMGVHEKLVKYPWVLVFDLWTSTNKGCHTILQNLHGWKLAVWDNSEKSKKVPGFFFRKEYTGVKVRENLFAGHKYTNLLKLVSPWGVTFWLFSLLDHQEMAFWHLKGMVTLEKTSKWN